MKAIVPRPIEDYAVAHSTAPTPLLMELEQLTQAQCTNPQMLVGRLEGAFLRMLIGLTGARRILEIGLFTGYSALTMAEALPADGEIISCEIDTETAKIAQSFFDRSPHGHKITIRLAPALDTLNSLPTDQQFDLVFLDADKESYSEYFEAVLPRLRLGGLLVADNTLWSGNVLAPKQETDHAVVAFNKRVQDDPRVENVLLTVRDGIMLARKIRES
jgi:caffeoyl-CoA O-methyltransferase